MLRTFGKGIEFARFIWPGNEEIDIVAEADRLVDDHELLQQAIKEAQVKRKEEKQYAQYEHLDRGFCLESDNYSFEKPIFFKFHTLVRINQELANKISEVPGVAYAWGGWRNWQYCLTFEIGRLFNAGEVIPTALKVFKKWLAAQLGLEERLCEQLWLKERKEAMKPIIIERKGLWKLIQNVYGLNEYAPYMKYLFTLITTFPVSQELANAIKQLPGVSTVLNSSKRYQLAPRFGELFDPAAVAQRVAEFIDEWLKTHPVPKIKSLKCKAHHEECEQMVSDKCQLYHEEGNELNGIQSFHILLKCPHAPELEEKLKVIPGMENIYSDERNRYKIRMCFGVLFNYLPIMYAIRDILEVWVKTEKEREVTPLSSEELEMEVDY